MYINLNAVVLIFKTRKLYRSHWSARNKNQGSISGLAVDRRIRAWKARRKERLNFIGRVANNFFAGEVMISATDASQLAIFYSFSTWRFMLSALFLSPSSLKQLVVLKRISPRARQFFHEIIFSSAALCMNNWIISFNFFRRWFLFIYYLKGKEIEKIKQSCSV